MPVPTTHPAKPLFVAVGHFGQRLVSEDGLAWKPPQVGKEGEVYRALAFGNGRIVAVGTYGGKNIIASSVDGSAWQLSTKDAQYKNYLRGIGFGNGTFVGIGGDPGTAGSSSPFVSLSPDGLTWSEFISIGGKNVLRRIAFGGGKFVAVGDRGRRAGSTNGREWTDAPSVKAIDTLIDIAYGNGIFVGVGLNGLRMSTVDGISWSPRQTGEEGEHLNSIVFTGDRFVAVGAGVTFVSFDGSKWDRAANRNAPLAVAYGLGTFVGSNWKGRILTSRDAITWTQSLKAEQHIEALAFGSV